MPRQNRVTPFGDLVAIPERGILMGNRGLLHDAAGSIRRSWQVKRWITCLREFKGRRRTVMAPGQYTELFFLDEATALAAGHRPCAECRRDRFNAFRRAWVEGAGVAPAAGRLMAPEVDNALHGERIGPNGSKPTVTDAVGDLPEGVFVEMADDPGGAYLVRGGRLLRWSPAGYERHRSLPADTRVTVLTPPSTVAAVRAGYVPDVHPSAVGR